MPAVLSSPKGPQPSSDPPTILRMKKSDKWDGFEWKREKVIVVGNKVRKKLGQNRTTKNVLLSDKIRLLGKY